MEAITAMSPERVSELSKVQQKLDILLVGTSRKDWFEDFRQQSGYAHYKFSGTITDKLVELLGHEPTATKLIIMIDSGFSHFGAQCSISGSRFNGRVNTD